MSFDKENEVQGFGFEILYPMATVSIGLQGLAACCYNESFNQGRGRWEIAIPRFADHKLRIAIDGFSPLEVDQGVEVIEIKARTGVPVPPKYMVGDSFNRKDRSAQDDKDFRWVTDYTNNEIPHGTVSVKEQLAPGVEVTMLYVYDATFYAKQIVPSGDGVLLHADLNKTGPVDESDRLTNIGINDGQVATFLEDLGATGDFGFSAATVGMDILSPRDGAVDILFDLVPMRTIFQGGSPQEILIVNREPVGASTVGRLVETEDFIFGRGDFFRYYELFDVAGEKFHLWERHPRLEFPGTGITGDCNSTHVALPNLDGLRRKK
jgi:hypothetical protein